MSLAFLFLGMNIMFLKNAIKFISSFLLLAIGFQSNANIGISTYRLYLDTEHNTENFIVTNRLDTSQQCEMGYSHYTFNELGDMGEYKREIIPENSASKLVRFSPKRFTLEAKQRQTVRFTFRRKKDVSAIEHRAFVTVNCKPEIQKMEMSQDNDSSLVNVSFKPTLTHNIPLVIRPKRLNASAEIIDVKMDGDFLIFDIIRGGSRSIYGKVQVLEKDNGKLITESKKLVMYIETTNKHFKLDLGTKYALDDVRVLFTEQKHHSGALNIEWSK